jgi:hypothetical protein
MADDLTPEQIEQINNYGNALLASPDMNNVRHPLQAIAVMLNALSGRQHVNLAEGYRARQRNEYTQRTVAPRNPMITGSNPTPDNPNPTPQPTQAQPTIGPDQTELRNRDGRLLRTIRTGRSGAEFTVADEYADRFQKLLDGLEGSGYDVIPDQSSGYNYRNIAGTNRLSQHAHGNAIDINSRLNARGRRGNIDPALAIRLAQEHGFRWGGKFPFRDDMHFEIDPNFKPPETTSLPLGGGAGTPTVVAQPGNALETEPATGVLTNRANLGMGANVAGNVQDQANEQPGLVTQAQSQGSPNAPNISRQLPFGAPPRIAPDLNIQRIERLLEMGANLNPDQVKELTKQYQELIQPKAMETTGGTSYYDPFSGAFMYFTPKLQVAPSGVGDVTTQDQYVIGQQGRQPIPRIPMTGTTGFAHNSGQPNSAPSATPNSAPGQTPPNISPDLPPYIQEILRTPSNSTTLNLPEFPQSGNVNELANFGAAYSTQRATIARTQDAAATEANKAREKASLAGNSIQSLNSIKAATLASPNLLRGQGIGEWAQKIAIWAKNLGINISGVPEGEIIQKLNNHLASLAVQDITARGTDFQLGTLMRNFPGLEQSIEGSLALIDYLTQEQQRYADFGKVLNKLGPDQLPRLNEIQTAFNEHNPTYLNIPGPRGTPGIRIYTGRITSIQDAIAKVKDGERFITPDGQLRIMTPAARARHSGGMQ